MQTTLISRAVMYVALLPMLACPGSDDIHRSGPIELVIEVVDPIDGERAKAVDPKFDEQLVLSVSGLPSLSEVQVSASRGSFFAIDSYSVSGSGEVEVDGDSLAWAMTADSPTADPLETFVTHYEILSMGQVVAEQDIARDLYDADVGIKNVEVSSLVGTLFTPGNPGPHPVIIVLGGSEGGKLHGDYLGRVLASHGYASLSLAYFGSPSLPQSLSEIPMGYFGEALAYLETEPAIDSNRIAVMGTSRGGELALQLGAHFSEVSAVIAEVPSGLRWGDGGGLSSWTSESGPLAFIPDYPLEPELIDVEGEQAYSYRSTFTRAIELTDPSTIESAMIQVEDTLGPILMVAGADDQIWPSCELAKLAMDRLESSGHSEVNDDRFYCYADTGHAIGFPGWPTTNVGSVFHPIIGASLATGGTPQSTATAQRAYRREVFRFLDANL